MERRLRKCIKCVCRLMLSPFCNLALLDYFALSIHKFSAWYCLSISEWIPWKLSKLIKMIILPVIDCMVEPKPTSQHLHLQLRLHRGQRGRQWLNGNMNLYFLIPTYPFISLQVLENRPDSTSEVASVVSLCHRWFLFSDPQFAPRWLGKLRILNYKHFLNLCLVIKK